MRPIASARSATFRAARQLRLKALEDRRLLAAGDLDVTFGNGGVVTTNMTSFQDSAAAVAVQPDGKIVVAGDSFSKSGPDGGAFAVVRYNSNGTLDSSFGAGGKVTTIVNAKRYDAASAVAIDTSGSPASNPHYGKIYVAGSVDVANGLSGRDLAFCLLRYNANGTLDTAFGGSSAKGRVITNFKTGAEIAYGLAVQNDGRVIVSGGGQFTHDFVLARYNPDGTLDASFAQQGKRTTDAGIISGAGPRGMVLQADGKIVVVAPGEHPVTGTDLSVVARYNANGTLDGSFGTGGLATIDNHRLESLAVQADGGVVASGYAAVGSSMGWALARLDAIGQLDGGFGLGGTVVLTAIGNAKQVAIAADGKIVAAGYAYQMATGEDIAVARLLSDGSLDPSFGAGGFANIAVSPFRDRAMDVAIQPDGRIVAAGFRDSGGDGDRSNDRAIAVARWLGDSPLLAESIGPGARNSQPLTETLLTPILAEAAARWSTRGADPSRLASVQIAIGNLPGNLLGLSNGLSITLDADAAAWGWYVDLSPSDDSEFATPGNQGEQDRLDLLTVVMHELGHLLGENHADHGVMAATLVAGVRNTGLEQGHWMLFDHLGKQQCEEGAAWLGAWFDQEFDTARGRAKRRA
jgi:uncharacterized delta-60 repeat protein